MEILSILLIGLGGMLGFSALMVLALYKVEGDTPSYFGFLTDLWLFGGAVTMIISVFRGIVISLTDRKHPVFPACVIFFIGTAMLIGGILIL
jgi:hypothetical protein